MGPGRSGGVADAGRAGRGGGALPLPGGGVVAGEGGLARDARGAVRRGPGVRPGGRGAAQRVAEQMGGDGGEHEFQAGEQRQGGLAWGLAVGCPGEWWGGVHVVR